jgi:hypothetical protein
VADDDIIRSTPRASKDKESYEYARQMVFVLKTVRQRVSFSWNDWEKEVAEAKRHKIWERLGYPSFDEMLQAEVGVAKQPPTPPSNLQLEVTHSLADYRKAASVLWGAAGEFCVDKFERLNDWLFAGELPPLPFVIGITAYGKCIGATRHGGEWDRGLPRITIASNHFRSGRNNVTETILHEMVHAKLILAKQVPDHNALPWCAEITRLTRLAYGKEIKVEPVKPRRVDGKVVRLKRDGYLSRDDLAHWPHCLHEGDASWDRGEPISVESY